MKAETRKEVWKKFNKRCAYCGCYLDYNKMQVDHINPKFRGHTKEVVERFGRTKGKDSIDNLNPSCGSCNSSKSTFTLEDWRQEIEAKKTRIIRDSSTFRILKRFGIIEMKDNPIKFHFENF